VRRAGLLGAALAMLVLVPSRATAELQLKPYVGLTFGGGTTLIDVGDAAGSRTFVEGIGFVYIGEVFGLEADASFAPGFFDKGNQRTVVRSSVGTLSGSLVVALPRRIAQYSLRPYLVGGFGWIRASTGDAGIVFPLRINMGAINIGGGATGFLTDRFGLGWDLRYFRGVTGGPNDTALAFGRPRLSFWRASMSVVLR
jgi:hypothetical protein